MSNEIKNQVQETEVQADGELNEEALMSVAGGAGAQQTPAPQQAAKTGAGAAQQAPSKPAGAPPSASASVPSAPSVPGKQQRA